MTNITSVTITGSVTYIITNKKATQPGQTRTEDRGIYPTLEFMKLAIGQKNRKLNDSTTENTTPLLKLLVKGQAVNRGQRRQGGTVSREQVVRRGNGWNTNTTKGPRDQLGDMWNSHYQIVYCKVQ